MNKGKHNFVEDDIIARQVTREELLKYHRRHTLTIITNIILIILIFLLGIYIVYNIGLIKMLGADYCSLCEVKTGAKCFVQNFFP